MLNSKIIFAAIIALCALLMPLSGRCDEPKSGDNKVLARINNYTLTTADFEFETKDKLPGGLSGPDLEKAKEGLLDDLITKRLLIQEAQKQNFDKDRAFVEEIERYWEQALLKLLYNKKSQELLRKIGRQERDPDIRDKKVQEAMNAWMEGLEKNADVKRYKENLKAVGPQSKKIAKKLSLRGSCNVCVG